LAISGTRKIDEYRVLIYGGKSSPSPKHRATILLFNQASDTIGSIKFYDPGTSLPDDFEKHKTIRMFLTSDMFLNVIDILRNEKPVYLHGLPGEYYLSTEKEPVGEEEGA
jgi:hypothetical protein